MFFYCPGSMRILYIFSLFYQIVNLIEQIYDNIISKERELINIRNFIINNQLILRLKKGGIN